MNGRVVHVNDNVEGAVYIGRAMPRKGLKASPFANPFRVEEWGRDMALAAFRDQFLDRLRSGVIDVEALIDLRDRPLACWCRHDGEPRAEANRCHGDFILNLLDGNTDDQLRELGGKS